MRLLVLTGENVAGVGLLFEMQFDIADIKLTQHPLDALFDGRIVGAITRDNFLDNGPQCRGRQSQMGNAHRVCRVINANEVAERHLSDQKN